MKLLPVPSKISEQVCQFVLDNFNCLKNFILVTCTGNHHFAGAENKADDLGVIKSVDESRELFWLIFYFIEW